MLRSQKQTQQNIRYIFFVALLLIFFATVGVKLLINTFIFVSNYTRDNKDNGTGAIDILAPAELFDVPDATNSARLVVSGAGAKGTEVTLYVNDEAQDTQTLEKDEFTFTAELIQGDNTLYLETQDPEGKKIRESQTYTVVFTSEKPTLSISNPSDGAIVDTDSVDVSGSTAPGASVQINNSPAVVDDAGGFSYRLPLQSGENVIVITSSDRAGNSDRVEMRVRREN